MSVAANPLWKGIGILFLVTVVVHALTGDYAILIDVKKDKRVLAAIAIILCIFATIYGTMTVLAFNPDAMIAMP